MSLKRQMSLEHYQELDLWTHDMAQAIMDLLTNDEQLAIYTAVRQVLIHEFSQSDYS